MKNSSVVFVRCFYQSDYVIEKSITVYICVNMRENVLPIGSRIIIQQHVFVYDSSIKYSIENYCFPFSMWLVDWSSNIFHIDAHRLCDFSLGRQDKERVIVPTYASQK